MIQLLIHLSIQADARIVTLEGDLRACAAGRADDAKRFAELEATLKNKNDDIKNATKKIGKCSAMNHITFTRMLYEVMR